MWRISTGVFLVALTTLVSELTLIRVFDVLWYPNMAYMIITLAMFSFGLAGVYASLRPVALGRNGNRSLALLAVLMGVFVLAIFPALNYLPFDYKNIGVHPRHALATFFAIYVVLTIPFFLGGLVLTAVFSRYAERIQRLYFWDLIGAALGCLIVIPLLPVFGAAGLLFVCCGAALFAAAFFDDRPRWRLGAAAVALAVIAVPLVHHGYFQFTPHIDKRNIAEYEAENKVETTRWDPISKIDVVSMRPGIKWLAYDGGSQTSYFYKFDGDYQRLLAQIPGHVYENFWGMIVLPSHYLKRNTHQKVLVIGAGGGQETKAALLYGASHVDAIELVGAVIDLGKHQYRDFIGGIYNDPRVNARRGEGRTFLRARDTRYDIIQMMSNQTSSSIAAGGGAMDANYLQTVDAYEEYFTHLKADGILHVNHHAYPRMVATAARAWRKLGRHDFRKHVIVFEAPNIVDNLPTLLIKMSPWTKREVNELRRFMLEPLYKMVVNPVDPDASFLSDDFFSGKLPEQLVREIPYRISVPTDDSPYFNFFRKSFRQLNPDPARFVNLSMAGLLNSRMQAGVPMDVIHLLVTGGAALVFAVVFLFVPLLFSPAGRARWPRKGSFLGYFGCLGAGFIIFELVFVQIFMKLIGYPLYTYSTVVFGFLFGAGLGSLSSERLGMYFGRRWLVPFAGVVISALAITVGHGWVFDSLLGLSAPLRIAVSLAMILPLAFFMGMPFPLGILAVRLRESGTIAWAWAFNGLFTVVGGVLSAVLSIYLGFQLTLLFAIVLYALAGILFRRIYQPHIL